MSFFAFHGRAFVRGWCPCDAQWESFEEKFGPLFRERRRETFELDRSKPVILKRPMMAWLGGIFLLIDLSIISVVKVWLLRGFLFDKIKQCGRANFLVNFNKLFRRCFEFSTLNPRLCKWNHRVFCGPCLNAKKRWKISLHAPPEMSLPFYAYFAILVAPRQTLCWITEPKINPPPTLDSSEPGEYRWRGTNVFMDV